MMSRGEIADLLMAGSVPELLAWRIAMSVDPAFLETATPAAVCANLDNLLSDYKQRTGDPEAIAPASWGWAR
jgi:hypothetical protein